VGEEVYYAPFSIRPDVSKPARIIQDNEGKLWLMYYDERGELRKVPISLVIFPQELGNLAGQIQIQDFIQQLRTRIQTSDIMVPVDIQGSYINVPIDIKVASIVVPVYIDYRTKGHNVLLDATVTANGNTADFDFLKANIIEIEIKVTAVSGTTPTLDMYIEGKFEDTGDYKTLASQTGINATGIWFLTVNPNAFRYIRVRYVVGGTSPSFTVKVVAQTVA